MSWDQSKFDAALSEYMQHTRKALPEVINTKGYYIARKALWFTKKVERSTIERELGRSVILSATATARSVRYTRGLELTPSKTDAKVTLAKMILSKRYRKSGDWPNDDREWEARIKALLSVRQASTAFLKSGWLGAIRVLGRVVTRKGGAAPMDSAAKTYGATKGTAVPAHEGNSFTVRIENSAIARHDRKNALQKYGGQALQKAFDDETASMIDYMEQQKAAAVAKANAAMA